VLRSIDMGQVRSHIATRFVPAGHERTVGFDARNGGGGYIRSPVDSFQLIPLAERSRTLNLMKIT
jgi:hypothetical protein